MLDLLYDVVAPLPDPSDFVGDRAGVQTGSAHCRQRLLEDLEVLSQSAKSLLVVAQANRRC